MKKLPKWLVALLSVGNNRAADHIKATLGPGALIGKGMEGLPPPCSSHGEDMFLLQKRCERKKPQLHTLGRTT